MVQTIIDADITLSQSKNDVYKNDSFNESQSRSGLLQFSLTPETGVPAADKRIVGSFD
jgi:hypothetical protein